MSIKNYFNSIEQNNEGCEYLECGDFVMARKCFRDALQFMTSSIVDIQNEMQGQVPQELDTGERLSDFQWSMTPNAPLHIAPETYLYQRAVFIFRDEDECSPTPFELSEESSMIVFNLGLAFHLHGVSTNTSTFLNEAFNFYQIAEAIRSRRPNVKNPELLDLALYNNMGHVCCEQVNYTQARVCFDALQRGLVHFSHYGMIEFLADDDSNGFVLNASIQEVTLAAAA